MRIVKAKDSFVVWSVKRKSIAQSVRMHCRHIHDLDIKLDPIAALVNDHDFARQV